MSSWLKCHEPACFLAAMLNSQPMGFYSPSQLVQDARRHGVEVLPADVTAVTGTARWKVASLVNAAEDREAAEVSGAAMPMQPAVRLGLRLVAASERSRRARLIAARARGAVLEHRRPRAARRARRGDMNALAAADALTSLSGHRRQQVWDATALQPRTGAAAGGADRRSAARAAAAREGEEIVFDYASIGLTLRRHPLALLRPRLAR